MKTWMRHALEKMEGILMGGATLLESTIDHPTAEKWLEDSCDAMENFIADVDNEVYLSYLWLATLLRRNRLLTPKQRVARSISYLADVLDYMWENLE